MSGAVIFDIDGTLVDAVDFDALEWHRAFAQFGYEITFQQARSQIGRGGDQLLACFLSQDQQNEHGDAMEAWRGERFKSEYLPVVRADIGFGARSASRAGVRCSRSPAKS